MSRCATKHPRNQSEMTDTRQYSIMQMCQSETPTTMVCKPIPCLRNSMIVHFLVGMVEECPNEEEATSFALACASTNTVASVAPSWDHYPTILGPR